MPIFATSKNAQLYFEFSSHDNHCATPNERDAQMPLLCPVHASSSVMSSKSQLIISELLKQRVAGA